jgi:hypothetical protein
LKFFVKTMHKSAGSWYAHNDNIDGGARWPGGAATSGTDFAGLSYNSRT